VSARARRGGRKGGQAGAGRARACTHTHIYIY